MLKYLLALFLMCNAVIEGRRFHACLKRMPKPKEYLIYETHRPENKYPLGSIPEALDWRWYNGQRYTTWSRNQHIPNYCGACWAFSSTSALSDRIMIMSNNQWPETDLSPQVLLTCEQEDEGCHGGDPNNAYAYIQENGIPSETCAPYTATGWDTGDTCNQEAICKNCAPGGTCEAQYPHQLYFVTEHGAVSGENAMLQALQEGPIACGMAVTTGFEEYQGFGIYVDPSNITTQEHAISIVGYGVENGEKYWIGRNSWGTYWGYDGYFRIIRGVNNLGIEESCSWATPAPHPIWVNSSSTTQSISDEQTITRRHRPCRPSNSKKAYEKYGEVITQKRPQDYIKTEDLPASWFWGDVNNTNFLTLARNQHIPQYCGSCWAFGTTSALGDRFNILRVQSGQQDIWPEINLAPQVLINEDGGGTCNGGDALGVYHYVHQNGIPHETCQAYQAKNDPHGINRDLNICENCIPGNTSATFTPGTCGPVTNFTLYYVGDYGHCSGIDNMKKEIYARGPISCAVDATSKFEQYTGGIFSEKQVFITLNHEISVVGWGVDQSSGEAYWVGRNSWGTYWGIEGFFYIKMGSDNLGIESECTYGVPSFTKVA